jgi:hypothetical protein
MGYVNYHVGLLSWRVCHPTEAQDWALSRDWLASGTHIWRCALPHGAHGSHAAHAAHTALVGHHLVSLYGTVPAAHGHVDLARAHLLALDVGN